MTRALGVISGVSVSHEHASVHEIEAVATESQREAVATLLAEPAVEEAFVLQTCNRAEAYVVTDDPAATCWRPISAMSSPRPPSGWTTRRACAS